MKSVSALLVLFFCLPILVVGQQMVLIPGKEIHGSLLKDAHNKYIVRLKKGEYVSCIVMQEGVDVTIGLFSPSNKIIKSFDSPNGTKGAEPVAFAADTTGDYCLDIYPTKAPARLSDSERNAMDDSNQGDYSIIDYKKMSAAAYKAKLANDEKEVGELQKWLSVNAHVIKTVDAGNGFDDLQPFRDILKGVTVVGLGESSHGTSEFFRMKHRILEFLIKEMGFCSFYLEASMTRCRYINDYVLYGKGNLDTATAMQGFVTWRVEEMRDMIEWLRLYNKGLPDNKRVKFLGFDLQINDIGWEGLHAFYSKVKPVEISALDTLERQLLLAAKMANSQDRYMEDTVLYAQAYLQCIRIKKDIDSEKVKYLTMVGENRYEENRMNITLIMQEIESFKDRYNSKRDYYMAENILYLLRREKPGSRVAVWAHNGHINNGIEGDVIAMGKFLTDSLKDKYYSIGFEFYSGSFQSRNMDLKNYSPNWDINTVGAPPVLSLPSYLNKTGKDMFYLDFRHMGALRNFSQPLYMHAFGSMYYSASPEVYPATLKDYDGLIYIKTSTAARNFKKVELRK